MRLLLAAALFASTAITLACSPWTRSSAHAQKLVILGFDGLDPALTQSLMKDGKLPNLSKLAAIGGVHPLETTPSPDTAPAWASFATGLNPGKHNIFDSFARERTSYRSSLALVTREPARFFLRYFPLTAERVTSTRAGTSFWVTAGAAGVRSSILNVPVTFPPEAVPNGELLAGLPLPDIRGTMGSFSYFATDVAPVAEGETEFGGTVRRLTFSNRVAQAELRGPLHPLAGETLRVPFTITWNHEARTANIDIQGQNVHLGERAWSHWIDLQFRANSFAVVRAMAQFHLIRAGTDLQLYVTAINWHPDAPPSPIASPPAFASELYERLGPYRTLSWGDAAWALSDELIDEATFMEDVDRAFDDRAATILHRIDSRTWDLLVGVIDTPDRVQHMMWRMIDPAHPLYDRALAQRHSYAIEHIYRRADEFVGDVVRRLEPGTTVVVMSAHGFQPYRWSVDLNSWLVQAGHMTLHTDASSAASESSEGTGWDDVDWSRTRAYSLGRGQINVNLQGREPRGLVAPAEYNALVDTLMTDLRKITDPQSGTRVVRNVYKRADVYRGPFVANAADLQVGFERGYRASWQFRSARIPTRVIEPNRRKWSGDHASFDYQATPGVLITNRKLTSSPLRLIDMAPTVLRYFGVPIPADVDGKPLF